MKKLLFLLFLIYIVISSNAAPVRIALIGDSSETDKIIDIALVELSKETKLELLERKEINKITAEHKLSAWSHSSNEIIRLGKLLNAGLFAVLRIEDKKFYLVVFDAKSAVRLTDQELKGNSAEALAKALRAVLKKTIPKLEKTNSLRKITLFSIRNVELPRSKDAACSMLAAKLTRKIGKLPDFAVIESRYIGLVNKERELTDISTSLSQASFLLNMDFYKCDIPNKALIKIEVNVPGMKSKHFTMNCDLTSLEIPAKKFSEIISCLRREKQKNNISPQTEATRYFEEYKATFGKKKFIERLPQIEAAVAYDNSNRKYLCFLLKTLAACALQEFNDKNNKKNAEEKINNYLDLMERWDRLMSLHKIGVQFSSAPHLHYTMCYGPLLYSINCFDPLNGNHHTIPDFSEATRQRLKNYHRRYVYRVHTKCRFKHWMNKDVKLVTPRNMFDFDHDLATMMDMYYPSQNEYVSHAITLMKLYLRKTAQTPEKLTDKNFNGRVISWQLWNRFFVCFKNFPTSSTQFRELEKTAQIAVRHPWAFVRLYGRFALYLADGKKNPSQSSKALAGFLNNLNEIFASIPKQKNTDSLINIYNVATNICCGALIWVSIPDVLTFYKKFTYRLFAIMKQRHELYFPLPNSTSWYIHDKQAYDFVKEISVYLNSKKWKIIGRENISSTPKSLNEKISRQVAEYLSRTPQTKDKTVSFPFEIEKLTFFKKRAVNAVIDDSGRYIYWNSSLLGYKKSTIDVYRYDTVTKQQSQIGKSISISYESQYNHIAIGENYLAISIEWANLIIIYNLKTGKATTVTVPFAQPKHIAVINDLLLVWCVKDNNLLQYKLPSLTYKVVYSANRRHSPSDPFNNQTVSFDTMFSDHKRQRAVILLSGYNLKRPGWWYYYPEKQKFEYVSRFPQYQHPRWTKINQDKILLPCPECSFILNLQDNTKELLLYKLYPNGTKAKVQWMKRDFERYYGAKARVTLNTISSHFILAAAAVIENHFWSNAPWRGIDLNTGIRTFYPSPKDLNDYALILRALDDKTLLMVNAKGIFKLHIKKNK